jgi:16S rRNA (guanine966-N2)-methyltransferase
VPRGTRPLADRAREGLFSSLGAQVPGARVLDLFAGTGALGIEALSRGAEHATFVDRSADAIATIRANLDRTKLSDAAIVRKRPVQRFLEDPRGGPGADLAFLDPPHAIDPRELDAVLRALPAHLAGTAWTVALTRPTRGYMPVVPVDWLVTRRLEYGESLVICYREA